MRSFRAVAWSFFGIRRSAGHAQDMQTLNPVHVIVAGNDARWQRETYQGHHSMEELVLRSAERFRGARGALVALGLGTERVEAEIARLFPAARVGRLDRDTTTRLGAHRRILEAWSAGKLDVLIGTQMVANTLEDLLHRRRIRAGIQSLVQEQIHVAVRAARQQVLRALDRLRQLRAAGGIIDGEAGHFGTAFRNPDCDLGAVRIGEHALEAHGPRDLGEGVRRKGERHQEKIKFTHNRSPQLPRGGQPLFYRSPAARR